MKPLALAHAQLTESSQRFVVLALLATVTLGCRSSSEGEIQVLPAGEGLPDAEIVFILEEPRTTTVLGFVNPDGTGYTTREVKASGGGIINNWFTWSPDGSRLVGKIGNTISPAGTPFIIGEAGRVLVCPRDGSVPYGPGRAWVISGNISLTVSFSSSERIYEVKSMDVENCVESATLYSASQEEVVEEAALSSQGWLAIERFPGSAPDEILILDSQADQVATIPDGRSPAWSMDGEMLAYLLGDGIYISNKDGSAARRLVQGPSANSPSWSPDGDWIVFDHAPAPAGPSVVEKANVASGETFRLYEGGFHPSWRWLPNK